jgi:MarR family transcriptional regulator for hemolysin
MPDLIKFDETISYMLAKVTTAFRSALERHMAVIGLHGGQIFVLLELWNQDGLRQIDLAKRLDLSAPTVNKMLRGMVQVRLVTVSGLDEDDKRSKRVFLTQQGFEMRQKVERQWLELEGECLAGLTETERLVLFEVLGKLRSTYTGRGESDDDDL